jgi:DNA repair protein RecO (recombination protein O)
MTMAMEKATAIVLRTTDWSESSRIATLWTRELGKVRALAKGGRRLRSSFESSLDLLTVCSIVLIRKSSGSLDLLTEAQVVRRFSRLQSDLAALYAAYYVAELLADWTQENDPHPALFDEALATLEALGGGPKAETCGVGQRVLRFEMVFLGELGYRPMLERCASCEGPVGPGQVTFSAAAGGVLCPRCRAQHPEARPLSPAGWEVLCELARPGDDWRHPWLAGVATELRALVGGYVTYLRGRPPRLLPYLGS